MYGKMINGLVYNIKNIDVITYNNNVLHSKRVKV